MSNRKNRTVAFAALSLISIVYDLMFIRRRPPAWMEKYTWATVVAGTLYTLAGLAIWDRQAARRALLAFVFSGWPMIAGDLLRWWERRNNGRSAIENIARKYGL